MITIMLIIFIVWAVYLGIEIFRSIFEYARFELWMENIEPILRRTTKDFLSIPMEANARIPRGFPIIAEYNDRDNFRIVFISPPDVLTWLEKRNQKKYSLKA